MDEEVVIEGSELHKYLLDQGFTDYEVLNKASSASVSQSQSGSKETEDMEITVDSMLDELCCHQLETILTSMLLFSDDLEQVEELARKRKKTVTANFSKLQAAVLSCLAAVSGGTIMARKLSRNIYLPSTFCFLTGVTVFIGDYFSRTYHRLCLEKQLSKHVKSLQRVCGVAAKLFRYLRETEIISTGKLPPASVYGTAYTGSRVWESDPQILPVWKTVPALRELLCEQLIELALLLSSATESIINLLPSLKLKRIIDPEVYSGRVSVLQVIAMKVNIQQECIPLADIHKLNETYLLAQSDYLKHLAWCFCPAVWRSKTGDHLPEIYCKVVNETERSLKGISDLLSVAYTLFEGNPRISLTTSLDSTKTQEPQPSISIFNEMHNASLQLYSLIYQMKEFEDNLDEMDENVLFLHVHQNHKEMLNNVETVFEEIRLSLIKTDQISRKALNMKNSDRSDEVPETASRTETDPNIRKTDVQVGASNYEIKTDEVDVFLGLSQDKNDKVVETDQQYYDDTAPKPQNQKLCRNLVKELKLSIGKRKKQYYEKEKISLEKKGLLDLDRSDLVEATQLDASDLCESPNENSASQHHRTGHSSFFQDSNNSAELSESSTNTIPQSHESVSNMSNGTIQQSDDGISPVYDDTKTSHNQPGVQFNPFPMSFSNEVQVSNEAVSVSRSWMATGVEEEFISEVNDSDDEILFP